jgi:hypothetical protein
MKAFWEDDLDEWIEKTAKQTDEEIEKRLKKDEEDWYFWCDWDYPFGQKRKTRRRLDD